jgi:hypothetical protein
MAKSIVSMELVHKIDVQLHVGNNNSRVVNQVISQSNAYMQWNLEILFYSCEKDELQVISMWMLSNLGIHKIS